MSLGSTLSSDTQWNGIRLGAHLSGELYNGVRYGSVVSTETYPPSSGATVNEGAIRTLSQFASAADTYTQAASNYTFYNTYIDRALVYGGSPANVQDLFASHGWYYNDIAADYANAACIPNNPTYVLKDAGNNYTFLHNFTPANGSHGSWEFATDPGSTSVRTSHTTLADSAISTSGYAGLMLDDVNPGGINTYTSGNVYVDPIDPRTSAAMATSAWRKYHAELVEQMQSAITPGEVVSNMHWYSGNNGFTRGFNDPYIARIIQASDFILLENGLSGNTGDNDVAWTFSFAALREFADYCHSHNTGLAWFNYDGGIDSQYVLATYFLLNEGYDYVGVVLNSGNPATYDTMYDFDLGPATSDRYVWSSSVWRRDFTSGTVVLQGPGMPTATSLSLGGTYLDKAGNSISAISAISAEQGIVLRSTGSPPTSPIAYVHERETGSTGTGSGTTQAITLDTACNAGNTVILCLAARDTSAAGISIADPYGNTWTVDASGNGSNDLVLIASTRQNAGTLQAGDSLTATFGTAPNGARSWIVEEISGLNTGTYLDKTGTNTASSTTAMSVSCAATTSANELAVVAYCLGVNAVGDLSQTITLDSGWSSFTTSRISQQDNSNGGLSKILLVQYKILSATGTQLNSTTRSGASSYQAVMATYKT